jgi:hypothetical protein
MINSISSQNYAVQKTSANTSKVEQTTVTTSKSSENINSLDTRQNALSFIETASPEELEAKVNSLTGRASPTTGAVINLREMMNSDNGDELNARIHRLKGQIEQEMSNVVNLEQDLISQGRAEGKSAKDILISIANMQDKQSDLYKMSIYWGGEGLTSPESYAKLVELTPTYVDYYA